MSCRTTYNIVVLVTYVAKVRKDYYEADYEEIFYKYIVWKCEYSANTHQELDSRPSSASCSSVTVNNQNNGIILGREYVLAHDERFNKFSVPFRYMGNSMF